MPDRGQDPRPVLLITDRGLSVSPSFATMLVSGDVVPSPTEIASAEMAIVFGPFQNGDRTLELSGSIKLALEHGATVVFLYEARFEQLEHRFMASLAPIRGRQLIGYVRQAATEPSPHPAFRDYVMLHGQTDLLFDDLPESAEVLANAVVADSPYETGPTAVHIEIGSGSLYILPWHYAGSQTTLLERLVPAVLEHREGRLVAFPPFFEELRLAGEDDVIRGMESARQDLDRLTDERLRFTQHKLLVGHLSGQQLEDRVIDELNLILEGSGLQARDVEERYLEDFEVVDEAGDRKALAEAKAASGGVTLAHVSQLDSHRSELEISADELPGLLVLNAFRNDETMERRAEAVSDRVVRHASRINVLVLRTWDLYQLVSRRLAGHDDSGELARLIEAGGGWLEVDDDGPRLRQPR
jgi:hypothetical protein